MCRFADILLCSIFCLFCFSQTQNNSLMTWWSCCVNQSHRPARGAALQCHLDCPYPSHSTSSLRAPVCFCFVLESSQPDSQGWSWPRAGEMSRLASKQPQSNQPLSRALTVLAFHLCRHHATSACFSSIFSLSSSMSVFIRRGWTCQWGLAAMVVGSCCQPCFEVSALTGGAVSARDLKAQSDISAQSRVTWQHDCVHKYMLYMNTLFISKQEIFSSWLQCLLVLQVLLVNGCRMKR